MTEKNDAKPTAGKPAAPKAKSAKEINKSEEIRKAATALKAKGEKPRPVTIIAQLGKQGVEVSSPQVSMVLKRMGFRPRRRRKGGKVAAGKPVATTAGSAKAVRTRATRISVDDLVAAQKVVSRLGGLDRALAAIEALRQFDT